MLRQSITSKPSSLLSPFAQESQTINRNSSKCQAGQNGPVGTFFSLILWGMPFSPYIGQNGKFTTKTSSRFFSESVRTWSFESFSCKDEVSLMNVSCLYGPLHIRPGIERVELRPSWQVYESPLWCWAQGNYSFYRDQLTKYLKTNIQTMFE